jgi:hypothetical protein
MKQDLNAGRLANLNLPGSVFKVEDSSSEVLTAP